MGVSTKKNLVGNKFKRAENVAGGKGRGTPGQMCFDPRNLRKIDFTLGFTILSNRQS